MAFSSYQLLSGTGDQLLILFFTLIMLILRWLTSCLRCSGLPNLGFALVNVMITLLLLWCSSPPMMVPICFAGCFIAGCVLQSVNGVLFSQVLQYEVSHRRIGAFLLLLCFVDV